MDDPRRYRARRTGLNLRPMSATAERAHPASRFRHLALRIALWLNSPAQGADRILMRATQRSPTIGTPHDRRNDRLGGETASLAAGDGTNTRNAPKAPPADLTCGDAWRRPRHRSPDRTAPPYGLRDAELQRASARRQHSRASTVRMNPGQTGAPCRCARRRSDHRLIAGIMAARGRGATPGFRRGARELHHRDRPLGGGVAARAFC